LERNNQQYNLSELQSYVDKFKINQDELKSLIGKVPKDSVKFCIERINQDKWNTLIHAVNAYHQSNTKMLYNYIKLAHNEIAEGKSQYTMKEFLRAISPSEWGFNYKIRNLNDDLSEESENININDLFNRTKNYLVDVDFVSARLKWIGDISCFDAILDHDLCEKLYNELFKHETTSEQITHYLSLPIENNMKIQDKHTINCMRALNNDDIEQFKMHFDQLIDVLVNIMDDAPACSGYGEDNFQCSLSSIFMFALYHCKFSTARDFYRDVSQVPLEEINYILPSSQMNDTYPYADKLCNILIQCYPGQRYLYLDALNTVTDNKIFCRGVIDLGRRMWIPNLHDSDKIDHKVYE
jgi:hypothetical protein